MAFGENMDGNFGTPAPGLETPSPSFDYSVSTDGGQVSSVANMRFPSLASQNDDEVAFMYMDSLQNANLEAAKRAASSGDPMRAGRIYADVVSMNDAFKSLSASGWGRKDASVALGLVGSSFESYGDAASRAGYLRRYAETAGKTMNEAADDIRSYLGSYRAVWKQRRGYAADATPDESVNEQIRNDFSDIIGGIRSVEDRYAWQFDRNTYLDVMNRCATTAADLYASGVSVRDVGAVSLVESALMSNGALRGDPNANPASRFGFLVGSDARRISLFGKDGVPDTLFNTDRSSKSNPADDSLDLGLAKGIRAAFAGHRARNLRVKRDPDDFSDVLALQSDLADLFMNASTNVTGLKKDTVNGLAKAVIEAVGNPAVAEVNVAEIAQAMSAAMSAGDPGQSVALAKWVNGLALESRSGQEALSSIVLPRVRELAAKAQLPLNDRFVMSFANRLYTSVKRRWQDLEVAAGLGGLLDPVAVDDMVRNSLDADLSMYTARGGVFDQIAAAANEAVRAKATARAEGAQDV